MIEEAAGTSMFEEKKEKAVKTMARKEKRLDEIQEVRSLLSGPLNSADSCPHTAPSRRDHAQARQASRGEARVPRIPEEGVGARATLQARRRMGLDAVVRAQAQGRRDCAGERAQDEGCCDCAREDGRGDQDDGEGGRGY